MLSCQFYFLQLLLVPLLLSRSHGSHRESLQFIMFQYHMIIVLKAFPCRKLHLSLIYTQSSLRSVLENEPSDIHVFQHPSPPYHRHQHWRCEFLLQNHRLWSSAKWFTVHIRWDRIDKKIMRMRMVRRWRIYPTLLSDGSVLVISPANSRTG